MSEATQADDARPVPQRAGQRLRAARETKQLALADIASSTRIPIRHLEAIESSSYADLPSPTYAVGFAKAYARAVGEDEVAIAREVRAEQIGVTRPPEYRPYEMADPARVPSRGLVIAGVIVALVLVIGAVLWFGGAFQGSPGSSSPAEVATTDTVSPAATPTVAAAAPATGPVTLTATARVWLRVYDADNQTLFMKTMDQGEKYQVPGDASRPMINVGRPDKLQVSIGNRLLPPLGSGARPIKDVAVDAASVEARAAGASSPTPNASPSATPTPSPSASSSSQNRSSPSRERSSHRPRTDRRPPPDNSPAPLSNGIY